MPDYLSADAMRALEKAAIDSGKVSGAVLMERAGESVLDAVFTKWPALVTGGQAIVLCGPGNNGGDGFVVARLLDGAGWSVTVYFYGAVEKLPDDARLNYDRWQGCTRGKTVLLDFPTVRQEQAEAFEKTAYRSSETSLVIDALFGIGLTRPLDGLRPILEVAEKNLVMSSELGTPRHVSIDLPSGLSEDGPMGTGFGSVFQAHLTVTFHRAKTAHRKGIEYCGDIIVQDIGL